MESLNQNIIAKKQKALAGSIIAFVIGLILIGYDLYNLGFNPVPLEPFS